MVAKTLTPPVAPPPRHRSVPHRQQYYQDNAKELRAILSQLAVGPPAYHDLQWRLDVTVRLWIKLHVFSTRRG